MLGEKGVKVGGIEVVVGREKRYGRGERFGRLVVGVSDIVDVYPIGGGVGGRIM